MSEFKFALGLACLAVGAVFLLALAVGLMTGVLPQPYPEPHVPDVLEYVVVGLFIIGIGLAIVGVILLALYFGEAYKDEGYDVKGLYRRAVSNVYEVVILMAVLVISGILTYTGRLETSVFVNITMLVVGYVAKATVEYVRGRLELS